MSKSIKLSEELIKEASVYASIFNRSVPKQIEYWYKIGKIAEENPDMSYQLIKETLISLAEAKNGEVEKYKFDY